MKPLIACVLLLCCFTCAVSQSTANQNEVAYRTYIASNNKMLDMYSKILERAGYRDYRLKSALINTQKAFLIYRQAEEKYQDINFNGGSMLPVFKYRALRMLTENRIKQLQYYANNL